MFYLRVCMHNTHMPGAYDGKTKALGPLKLELGMVVSHHVGAGN